MKSLLATTIATCLCVSSAIAGAADAQHTLAPITVNRGIPVDCTPPSYDDACSALHVQIRHTFSKREIGMLFGARTSYPEYLTAYEQVQRRYKAFLRDVDQYGPESVALVVR